MLAVLRATRKLVPSLEGMPTVPARGAQVRGLKHERMMTRIQKVKVTGEKAPEPAVPSDSTGGSVTAEGNHVAEVVEG